MSGAPYRTAEAPAVTPLSGDELVESALRATLAALRDLDGDQARSVLLSVSALFDLGLAHLASETEPVLSITDAVKLLKAARGVAT